MFSNISLKKVSVFTILLNLLIIWINSIPAFAIEVWLTKSDQTILLKKQSGKLSFGSKINDFPTISINENQRYQTIDGFGYSLTGGSAIVINRLDKDRKRKLLSELFGKKKDSIKVSYLRISIGASDLNFAPFTYHDIPDGETDPELKAFDLKDDDKNLVPLLQEILKLNPKMKIMGSPWSAPLWMKDKNSFLGGRLKPEYYGIYALYFVRYIKEMEKRGIKIEAITPQNEPLHDGNNPSMLMSAREQAEFIKNHLGKAFQAANIKTKIIIYDHNCDKPEYPIEVLNDAEAKKFIDGSAFHLYGGDIGCMSKVKEAHPDKNLYFTEQYTSSKSDFGGDLNWHIKNLIIGATRNWSKNVLEWNLANDEHFKLHTQGGCNICKGALTITSNSLKRNVSYYIIAQASKFVPPDSVRIDTNLTDKVNNVAFKTPTGKIVLIAHNEGKESVNFNIKFKNKFASAMLPAGSVGTYIWK